MVNVEKPNVGSWYRTRRGEIFEVVVYDESEGTIDIQYEDGTVDELDLESWYELGINEVKSPKDWRGSMDPGTDEEK